MVPPRRPRPVAARKGYSRARDVAPVRIRPFGPVAERKGFSCALARASASPILHIENKRGFGFQL